MHAPQLMGQETGNAFMPELPTSPSPRDEAQALIAEANARVALAVGPSETKNPQLTPREGQILVMMAEGMTNGNIGEHLGISVKTVEAHRARIFRKLGADNAPHAVAIAFRRGMLA